MALVNAPGNPDAGGLENRIRVHVCTERHPVREVSQYGRDIKC